MITRIYMPDSWKRRADAIRARAHGRLSEVCRMAWLSGRELSDPELDAAEWRACSASAEAYDAEHGYMHEDVADKCWLGERR